jgi:subtilisin family serine protease
MSLRQSNGKPKRAVVRLAAFLVCLGFISAIRVFDGVRAQEPAQIQTEGGNPARLAALLSAVENGVPYMPDEVLVRFRPGSEPRQQSKALSVIRGEMRPENARWIGDVLHVKGLRNVDPLRVSEDLQRQPEVLYAQPNYIRPLKSVPNDAGYSRQWQLEVLNMPRAWDINPGGKPDVLVAVIDSGLTTTTDMFKFRIWTGRSFELFTVPFVKASDFDHTKVQVGREFMFDWHWVAPGGNPLLFDAAGHGTHVAGTIAQQTNNNEGYAGVAYGVSLLPLKVCWSYWDAQMAFGAEGIPGIIRPDFAGCTDDAQVKRCGMRRTAGLA